MDNGMIRKYAKAKQYAEEKDRINFKTFSSNLKERITRIWLNFQKASGNAIAITLLAEGAAATRSR